MPKDPCLAGRYGALKSWSNTVDRTERTTNARRNGPGQIAWHLARLDAKFDSATDAQRLAAAEAARRAWYAALAMRSAQVRQERRAA